MRKALFVLVIIYVLFATGAADRPNASSLLSSNRACIAPGLAAQAAETGETALLFTAGGHALSFGKSNIWVVSADHMLKV
jgi:hypothetical protein